MADDIQDGMQASYDEIIAQKRRSITAFQKHRDVMVQNLNAFIMDATEAIHGIDQTIDREAKALHDLEMMQSGQPIAVPSTAAQATARRERDEEQIKLEKEFQRGKIAPGFLVERPADAKVAANGFATWVHEMPAYASPGDEIDEQGNRHILHNGRHEIWDQHGKKISDEPIIEKAKNPNGAPTAGA